VISEIVIFDIQNKCYQSSVTVGCCW